MIKKKKLMIMKIKILFFAKNAELLIILKHILKNMKNSIKNFIYI